MTAELYLLLACTVLAAALIVLVALGRYDARNADQVAGQRDEARRERDEARARASHYQQRNDELRRELETLTGPALADLAALPTTHDREYPR